MAKNKAFREHFRQNIQNACFTNFFLAIPKNEDVFKQYSTQTEIIFKKISSNSKESHELSKLRDTLLPKLLSGEIRIKAA